MVYTRRVGGYLGYIGRLYHSAGVHTVRSRGYCAGVRAHREIKRADMLMAEGTHLFVRGRWNSGCMRQRSITLCCVVYPRVVVYRPCGRVLAQDRSCRRVLYSDDITTNTRGAEYYYSKRLGQRLI